MRWRKDLSVAAGRSPCRGAPACTAGNDEVLCLGE